MNQEYIQNPFETAKNDISKSSRKLYLYSIWTAIIGVVLAVAVLITVFVFLSALGITLADIDLDNIYETADIVLNSGLIASGLVVIIILGITLLALIIISILSYVQYYRLGTGFKKLHEADSGAGAQEYISWGIYGYVIAAIVGIFIPGIGGNIVSLLGSVSLAVGIYMIYLLFKDYKEQGRFKGKPSMILFIGVAIEVIVSISSFINDFGALGSIIGIILMIIGFNILSREIMLVEPPNK